MSDIDPFGRTEFTFEQVAESIAARIQAGEFQYLLPAERHFAEEYCVAYQTLRRAMALLRERGLIVTRMGRGTFVNPATRAPETSPDERASNPGGPGSSRAACKSGGIAGRRDWPGRRGCPNRMW